MPEPQTLSEREIEILTALATGKSNKEIAQALNISANTVKVHVRNIFAKLEVASRTEASMVALRLGLIDAVPTSPETTPLPPEDQAPADPLPEATAASSQPGPRLPVQTWLAAGLVVIATLLAVIAFRLYTPGAAATPTAPADQIAIESQWQNKPDMPEIRTRAAAIAFENQIFVFGGLTDGAASAAVLRYDPALSTWTTLPNPKPTPVSEIQAAVLGGRIYIPGGLRSDGQVSSTLDIYDPRTGAWESGPDMPTGLSGYALAAHEGKLYVFGGWDGADFTDQVLIFDPDSGAWSSGTPVPARLGYAGAAVAGGRIYLIGGTDGRTAARSTWIYNPSQEGNTPWSPAADLPEGRYAMGLVSIADRIHLIGGLGGDSGHFSQMDYTPQSDLWQVLDNPLAGEWAHLAAASFGTEIYAFGGELGGAPSDRSLSFQVLFVVVIPVIR